MNSKVNCLISLFYIKPQHAQRLRTPQQIVSYLFSTSNHNWRCTMKIHHELSHISFLHQTTTALRRWWLALYCLISLFYIKPQQSALAPFDFFIVSYLFSTSNHNAVGIEVLGLKIVSYLFSTSNHNKPVEIDANIQLSHISFLHQTTTWARTGGEDTDCLISLFYIKPQPFGCVITICSIVSYLFSTSNHNCSDRVPPRSTIVSYLFSTSNHNW